MPQPVPAPRIRPWKQQLATGLRPVQDGWNAEVARSTVIHSWESSIINGMFQTADYARHVLKQCAQLHGSPRDTEDAVQARLKRQELLHKPGRKFRVIMWEAALLARICPPVVLAAQLDRLLGVMNLDSVELGIVPLHAALDISPGNDFYILDDRVATVEEWHAEYWLEDADSIDTYLKVWHTLRESAACGAEAQNVINRARRQLGCSPSRY